MAHAEARARLRSEDATLSQRQSLMVIAFCAVLRFNAKGDGEEGSREPRKKTARTRWLTETGVAGMTIGASLISGNIAVARYAPGYTGNRGTALGRDNHHPEQLAGGCRSQPWRGRREQ